MRKWVAPWIALIGCTSGAPSPESEARLDWEQFAVIATIASDYSVGALSAIEVETLEVRDNLSATTGDSVVRTIDNGIAQLNRFNYDTVRIYSLRDWTVPRLEFSVGSLANPHDAAVCEDKLFVSLYGRNYIGVYSLLSGIETGRVSLTDFDDGDTTGPEASRLVTLNGRLYAGLHRFNRDQNWQSEGSVIAEIDCGSEAVVRSWAIGANATMARNTNGDSVLVAAEAFEGEPGGAWELRPNESSEPQRIATSEEGVHFTGIGATPVGTVLSQFDENNHYGVRCLTIETGDLSPVLELPGFITDLAVNQQGEAWVTTRPHWENPTSSYGVWIVDPVTCELKTPAPVETNLPPYAIDFVQGVN